MRVSIRSWMALASLLLLFAITGVAQQNKNVQITKGPTVENVTGNTATIAWSTNTSASTVLKYGTDRNNLNQSAQAPWGGLTHRVTLKDLQPNTTYFYEVQSGQGQGTGTGAMSGVQQFQTKSGPTSQNTGQSSQQASGQSSQPSGGAQAYNASTFAVVAGPIPQQITDTSAKLWWQTNQQLTGSVVKYGTSPSAMNQQAQSTQSGDQMSHTAELTGLQPNTQYYVSIVRLDGNVSTTGNFKTMPPNFASSGTVRITNGPVIEHLADNRAIVSWSTSAPSSSTVKYGTSPNALNQTAQAPWSSGTHRVTLKNLQPNTKYWFQIQSSQAQGTGTAIASEMYPFQTIAPGQSALNLSQQ